MRLPTMASVDFIPTQKKPPVWERAAGQFPVDDTTIFAYAPYVYVPEGVELSEPLMVHEQTHINQQGDDPAGWWERYFEDEDFRFGQELQAHQAEYKQFRRRVPHPILRKAFLAQIALRLAGPLYGRERDPRSVARMIKKGATR